MIAVVGEALIDAHLDGDLLRPFPGGGPFNTAIALARLGTPACFLGSISRDRFGRQLEQTLHAAGVDTSGVVRVDAPTPIAIVDSASVEPSYSFYLAGTAHEALQPARLRGAPPSRRSAARRNARARDRSSGRGDCRVRRARGGAANARDRPEHPARDDRGSRRLPERFERLAQRCRAGEAQRCRPLVALPGPQPARRRERLLERGAGCVAITHGSDGAEAWTAFGVGQGPARQT